MKHSKKMIFLEFVLVLISLFCLFVYTFNYYVYLFLLVCLAVGLYLLLKPPKRQERFNTDIILVIIVSVLFYYAITNFIGFFSGFYYSTYSHTTKGFLYNLITSLVIIICIETIREVLIKNHAYHKSIVYLTPLVCLLLELPASINFSLYVTKVDLFNAFLTLIIPSLVKSIVLTFIVYKSNKECSILYQLMMTLPNFVLPVFPNLGDFFSIVANVTLPIVVFVIGINVTTVKFEKITNSRRLGKNSLLYLISHGLLVTMVLITLYLTSNMFRFSSLAIGSASMEKVISKGDIVIIDKKNRKIKKGEVIAFEQGGRIIVHRVVDVLDDNGKDVYITKGDANNAEDGWTVGNNNLTGKVIGKLKWIGWPTIALSELLS